MKRRRKETASQPQDSLKTWKERHPSESKLMALLEIDWPGSQEICRRFIRQVTDSNPDKGMAESITDHCLSSALATYRGLLQDRSVPDRERLSRFIRTLASELIGFVDSTQTADELSVQWVPKSLAKALEIQQDERQSPNAA
jgi:hypothetical protein